MSIRWLWLDFVNPEVPLSPAQRRRIRRAVMRPRPHHAGDPWKLLIVFGGRVAAAILLAMSLPHFLPISWANPETGGKLIGLAVLAWLTVVVLATFWFRRRTRDCVHRLRLNHCMHCGYPRTKLPKDSRRCPECGEAFESHSAAV